MAPGSLIQELCAFRKKVLEAHKALVSLDIKVRKWSTAPREILDILGTARAKTSVYVDLCGLFETNKPKMVDKMKAVFCSLISCNCVVFPAIRGAFFRHFVKDYIRFNKVAEVADACDRKGELFDKVAGDQDVANLVVDTIADGLHDVVSGLLEDDDKKRTTPI